MQHTKSVGAKSIKKPFIVLIVILSLFVIPRIFYNMIGAALHQHHEVAVPDLRGKTLDDALNTLMPLKLSLTKEAMIFDESSPRGTIIRQRPPAGLKVREGKAVRVTLSSGGEKILVPEVIGRIYPEAESLLKEAGLTIGTINEAYSLREPANVVVKQDPAANQVAIRGNQLNLTVSRGIPPEGTTILPDFTGESAEKAMKWGDANKITVKQILQRSSTAAPGAVLKQSPEPDSVIEQDKSLEITVCEGTGESKSSKSNVFTYNVPKGSGRVKLDISLLDSSGERKIFEGYRYQDESVEIPFMFQGYARVRTFVNGILVEERRFE